MLISVCSVEIIPVVVFQSSDATGQSPILSMSFRRGWESRCSMRPVDTILHIVTFNNNSDVSLLLLLEVHS